MLNPLECLSSMSLGEQSRRDHPNQHLSSLRLLWLKALSHLQRVAGGEELRPCYIGGLFASAVGLGSGFEL